MEAAIKDNSSGDGQRYTPSQDAESGVEKHQGLLVGKVCGRATRGLVGRVSALALTSSRGQPWRS
eukprot:CAMPEP_0202081608 /NCGR_PEP_ID=MMETSP0964-20121228/15141_1 /ASSEMBLY_ACC=CAM_ASM_000500 /TAXON_ID=4773 /ORGANISM="Schizochytrium aggregatum, Strain ATCC28209" /LENGTH=64 /DNA_ID=CAMNT_0048649179 /DNA_START=79 /DNA_END=269 /DNA_ORIENTATION=-